MPYKFQLYILYMSEKDTQEQESLEKLVDLEKKIGMTDYGPGELLQLIGNIPDLDVEEFENNSTLLFNLVDQYLEYFKSELTGHYKIYGLSNDLIKELDKLINNFGTTENNILDDQIINPNSSFSNLADIFKNIVKDFEPIKHMKVNSYKEAEKYILPKIKENILFVERMNEKITGLIESIKEKDFSFFSVEGKLKIVNTSSVDNFLEINISNKLDEIDQSSSFPSDYFVDKILKINQLLDAFTRQKIEDSNKEEEKFNFDASIKNFNLLIKGGAPPESDGATAAFGNSNDLLSSEYLSNGLTSIDDISTATIDIENEVENLHISLSKFSSLFSEFKDELYQKRIRNKRTKRFIIFSCVIFKTSITSDTVELISFKYINKGIARFYLNIVNSILYEIETTDSKSDNKTKSTVSFFSLNYYYLLEMSRTLLNYIITYLKDDESIDIKGSEGEIVTCFDYFDMFKDILEYYFDKRTNRICTYGKINDWTNCEKLFRKYDELYVLFDRKKYEELTGSLLSSRFETKQKFSEVFDHNTTPEEMATFLLLNITLKRKMGVLLMTYGYSGTGKSTSIYGTKNQKGFIQSTIERITGIKAIKLKITAIYGNGYANLDYWKETSNIKQEVTVYNIELNEVGEISIKNLRNESHDTGFLTIDDTKIKTALQSLGSLLGKIKERAPTISTSNNPESIRSIIVLEFHIVRRKFATPLIIVDLPGKEDIFKTYVEIPPRADNPYKDAGDILGLYAASVHLYPIFLSALFPDSVFESFNLLDKSVRAKVASNIDKDGDFLNVSTFNDDYIIPLRHSKERKPSLILKKNNIIKKDPKKIKREKSPIHYVCFASLDIVYTLLSLGEVDSVLKMAKTIASNFGFESPLFSSEAIYINESISELMVFILKISEFSDSSISSILKMQDDGLYLKKMRDYAGEEIIKLYKDDVDPQDIQYVPHRNVYISLKVVDNIFSYMKNLYSPAAIFGKNTSPLAKIIYYYFSNNNILFKKKIIPLGLIDRVKIFYFFSNRSEKYIPQLELLKASLDFFNISKNI